jgi:predicted acyl esterase
VRNAIRGAAVLCVLSLLALPARAQDEAWERTRRDVPIPMRDGAELAADVHLPPKAGRYPVVVIQTPYGKRHHGAERPGGSKGGLYDREHYAYVVVDWRGFHGSRRARRGKRRGALGRDGHDVVEWAAGRPWSNGRVGTWGPSALGKVQFETAAERPPHLVCAVPLVAGYGHRYEDYFEGGVLREEHLLKLTRLGFGTMDVIRTARKPDAPIYALARSTERWSRIDVPMLLVTGWYDHGTARHLECFELLAAKGGRVAREQSRLLVGPWHHTAVDEARQGVVAYPAAAGEMERETRAFLDFHLRGVGNGWDARARIRVWRCNEDGWRGRESWPGDAAEEAVLHLRAVVADPARPVPTLGGANLPGRLQAGPADQERLLERDDVLAYATEPLERPLRVAGRVRLEISLRADRPDVDVAVRLCEVLPDGRTVLVADAIRRAQFRADGRFRRLAEDELLQVPVDLPPLAFTFRRGHRLRVLVAASNWPRFERNPHTGGLTWDRDDAVPAEVAVFHAAATPSRLRLPLLPDLPPAAPPNPGERPEKALPPGGGR